MYAVAGVPLLLAASAGLTAGGLLRAGRARATAVLLAATAVALVLGVVSPGLVVGEDARLLWVLAALLLAPAALVLYPSGQWHHPSDFVALVTVIAAGALALVVPSGLTTMTISMLLCLLIHTWWRLERASGLMRRSVAWLALGAGTATLVAGILSFALPEPHGAAVAAAVLAAIGPALYVGAVRPEQVDVRAVVVTTVSYLAAAVCFVAAFVMAAAVIEVGTEEKPSVPVLAVVGTVLALAVHPAQVLLRGTVSALIFGARRDPLEAAGLVSERVSDDPVVALRAIREALVLPYAALQLDGVPVAESGDRDTATETRALPDTDGRAMTLVVGLRSGDLALSVDERRVLAIAAPLLAQSLRASRLALDLRDAQRRGISAREEERRRLRRDLHDGLGPQLTGIVYTADAVRNLVASDPAAAARLVDDLGLEARTAIASVRELVEALRPPALDELGLAGALRQVGTSMRHRSGVPLQVSLDLAGLAALPAAVEVAVYRIVVEALTNVARHGARAGARVVVSRVPGEIEVVVSDTGPGDGSPWPVGIGLASMRERAEELGGRLEAGPSGTGGGRVRAVIPVEPGSARPSTGPVQPRDSSNSSASTAYVIPSRQVPSRWSDSWTK